MPPKNKGGIISIDKKEQLTLLCEWEDCMQTWNVMHDFMIHVTNHRIQAVIDRHMQALQDGTEVDTKDICCKWKECGYKIAEVSTFTRHTNFHAFHVKIKCYGMMLMLKNQLPKCAMDYNTRNLIPELPERLECAWLGCQEMFDNPEYFYTHVRNHVDDENGRGARPEGGCKCKWEGCVAKFKNKYVLREHVRCHTQERIFACPNCGGLFCNATKFYDHIQKQLEPSGLSYQCSDCKKQFSTERLLRDHMRHHVSSYKCPLCDMTCQNPSGLNAHIRYRHNEERPYKCDQCSYRAKISRDLRRHVVTHGKQWIKCTIADCQFRCRHFGELGSHYHAQHEDKKAVYICHVCEKKFSRGSLLTTHLKSKHKFKWPPGHIRFRYKQGDDGYFRLQTIRYESIQLAQQLIDKRGQTVQAQVTYLETNQSGSTNTEQDSQPSAQGTSNNKEPSAQQENMDYSYNLDLLRDVALQQSACENAPPSDRNTHSEISPSDDSLDSNMAETRDYDDFNSEYAEVDTSYMNEELEVRSVMSDASDFPTIFSPGGETQVRVGRKRLASTPHPTALTKRRRTSSSDYQGELDEVSRNATLTEFYSASDQDTVGDTVVYHGEQQQHTLPPGTQVLATGGVDTQYLTTMDGGGDGQLTYMTPLIPVSGPLPTNNDTAYNSEQTSNVLNLMTVPLGLLPGQILSINAFDYQAQVQNRTSFISVTPEAAQDRSEDDRNASENQATPMTSQISADYNLAPSPAFEKTVLSLADYSQHSSTQSPQQGESVGEIDRDIRETAVALGIEISDS